MGIQLACELDAMNAQPFVFLFDDVKVDAGAHRFERGGREYVLEPKAFGVLLEFLGHPGMLLTSDQLLDAVWGHRHVTSSVLKRVVVNLRKALGDNASEPRYIETVHGLGYRFIGPVRAESPSSVSTVSKAMPDGLVEGLSGSSGVVGSLVSGAGRVPMAVALVVLVATTLVLWLVFPKQDDATVVPPVGKTSLAVLPILAFGGERNELVAAADGLSESLIDAFARTPGMIVEGRESSFALGRANTSPSGVADAFGVDYVLNGELYAEGEILRLNVGLWRRGETVPVWTSERELPREQLFRVLIPIVTETRSAMGLVTHTIPPVLHAAVPSQDLYWLGRYHWYRRTPQSLARALVYFHRSVEQDERFALGHAGIADTCLLLYEYGDMTIDEAAACAQGAIARAKEIQPDLADAYASEGLLNLNLEEFGAAAIVLKHALELEPNLPNAKLWYGNALAGSGRVREARAWHEAMAAQDQLNPVLQTYLGVDALLAADSDGATRHLRRAIELDDTYAEPYWQLALQEQFRGRLAEAIAFLSEVRGRPGQSNWTALNAAYVYLLAGDAASAERELEGAPGISPLNRLEAMIWVRWLQGRIGEMRNAVDGIQVSGFSARRRAALSARVSLFDGRDDEARRLYEQIFSGWVDHGDPYFRAWCPHLDLGHFTAWVALQAKDSPLRLAAIDAYARQLDRYASGGMRLPVLTYQRAVVAALRGDVDTARRHLEAAMLEGWLDVSALRRDPVWRPYWGMAWLLAAEQRVKMRASAELGPIVNHGDGVWRAISAE